MLLKFCGKKFHCMLCWGYQHGSAQGNQSVILWVGTDVGSTKYTSRGYGVCDIRSHIKTDIALLDLILVA